MKINQILKNTKSNIKIKLIEFIKNKKGSDDKNTGSAMAMIFSVVIGFLLLTTVYGFMNGDFFPAVFNKILEALNYSG